MHAFARAVAEPSEGLAMATSALQGAAPKPSEPIADGGNGQADAAIARVLAAERDARTAVADCALQAEGELQAGRERARLITARGAERVANVQHCIEARIAAMQTRIAAERERLGHPAGERRDDAQRLAAAVDVLADELSRGALAAGPPR